MVMKKLEPVNERPLVLDTKDDGHSCIAHTSVTCGQNSGIPMCWDTIFFPTEQGNDDSASLCWESHELERAIDILGQPCVSVRVSCDQSRGIIALRLCDVFPDGTSMLITKGRNSKIFFFTLVMLKTVIVINRFVSSYLKKNNLTREIHCQVCSI